MNKEYRQFAEQYLEEALRELKQHAEREALRVLAEKQAENPWSAVTPFNEEEYLELVLAYYRDHHYEDLLTQDYRKNAYCSKAAYGAWKKHQRQEKQRLRKQAEEALKHFDADAFYEANRKELNEITFAKIRRFLSRKRGIGTYTVYRGNLPKSSSGLILTAETYEIFCQMVESGAYLEENTVLQMLEADSMESYTSGFLMKPGRKGLPAFPEDPAVRRQIEEALAGSGQAEAWAAALLSDIRAEFTLEKVIRALRENPYVGKVVREAEILKQMAEALDSGMQVFIPERAVDLYPEARAVRRHFVLHIGPTNSGKTYHAMMALREAGSGAYFAPLRLLAFEQYETMNRAGYPCEMITGEERIEMPGAEFLSATVEMASTKIPYDAAVIDECQMAADEQRGGAWTRAILGLICPKIHLCAAPEAEGLLIRMIRDCGDTYEVVYHTRRTKLQPDSEPFEFPDSLQKGDALIVFSRAAVHAVAMEIRRTTDFDCSVIYGALPYDVRHEEARKFDSGETGVVVATDAIGMGLNLPIRRIVFLEGTKFDGYERRPLEPQETKQIAGRAGRFGIYDEGYYTCGLDIEDIIWHGMTVANEPLETAVFTFPESLLAIDAPLSKIMERWVQWKIDPLYTKEDMSEVFRLVTKIEDLTEDKDLLYRLVTMPFDADDETLFRIWFEMALQEIDHEAYLTEEVTHVLENTYETADITKAELMYKECDLLYFYNERFGYSEKNQEIMSLKRLISGRIIDLLDENQLQEKRCKRCGRKLAWNYPFSVCERCHGAGRYRGNAASGGQRGRGGDRREEEKRGSGSGKRGSGSGKGGAQGSGKNGGKGGSGKKGAGNAGKGRKSASSGKPGKNTGNAEKGGKTRNSAAGSPAG